MFIDEFGHEYVHGEHTKNCAQCQSKKAERMSTEMTVAGLIAHLRTLPADFPVSVQDRDGDWVPLLVSDIELLSFSPMGRDTARDTSFFIAIEDDSDHSSNGVGIRMP